MSINQTKQKRYLYLAIALISLFLLGQCYEIYQEISNEGYTTREEAKKYSEDNRYGIPEVNLSELNLTGDER